ncbi:MAG: flagellar motor protein MotB [Rickettsiales bacterium]
MHKHVTHAHSPHEIGHANKRDSSTSHGTGWKVAYADFVTAMMAFFLLLWLYSTMDTAQKNNIADYFTPTEATTPGGAVLGATRGGQKLQAKQGENQSDLGRDGIVKAQLSQGSISVSPTQTTHEDEKALDVSLGKTALGNLSKHAGVDEVFMAISEAFQQIRENNTINIPNNNVMLDKVRNTIRITIISSRENPVFDPYRNTLTALGKKQLASFSRIIAITKRNVTIGSHTATFKSLINQDYTGWEISADRAKLLRQQLHEHGVSSNCILEIANHADRKPLVPSEPANPRNNRLTITLQNSICDMDE